MAGTAVWKGDVDPIELFSLKCRRNSIWRVPGQILSAECSSLMVLPFCSHQFEPEWVQLPGLYLLSDCMEEFRRARVRCDEDSFVVTALESLPACHEFPFFPFATLYLNCFGDLAEFELRTSPSDPYPILLGREYVHILLNCTQGR